MPQIPEYQNRCADTVAISLGGSTLFPREHPELNTAFFQELISFIKTRLADNQSLIAVVGGGEIARKRQEAARAIGITDQHTLDLIGIYTTRHNADYIRRLLLYLGVNARRYNFQSVKPGIIYLRGGEKPGSTTDLTAVKAAVSIGSDIINVSNTRGLYPFLPDGTFDRSTIVDQISYEAVLPHLPQHRPGINIPFSREAMLLAKENAIRVILVGTDLNNLADCLCGRNFTGTVIS